MDLIDKEAYFYYYCPRCVNENTDEGDEPCNDCLAHPSNQNSHKPTRFKPKSGEEDYIYPEHAPAYHGKG